MHTAGIIHSDIKHKNIMVETKTNTPFIIDLGSGIEANNQIQGQSMAIREFTCSFSSPEYFLDDNPHFKSDVWSLGCLLYFMVSESDPWSKKTRI